MAFWAYILHCADGSYYTGHTDHLENRIADHQHGRLRGYTINRRPIRLVWSQDFPSRHEALQAERQIKGWSRAKKKALIEGRWDEISRLAKGRSGFVLRQAQDEREICEAFEETFVRGELVEPRIAITPDLMDALQGEATRAAPHECCGILLGEAGQITAILPTRNAHPTPTTHFEIDPQALIDAHRAARDGGPEVLGYYHSHPAGPAEPSNTDRAMAAGDGRIWAIIGSDGETRFWHDLPEGFRAVSYTCPPA